MTILCSSRPGIINNQKNSDGLLTGYSEKKFPKNLPYHRFPICSQGKRIAMNISSNSSYSAVVRSALRNSTSGDAPACVLCSLSPSWDTPKFAVRERLLCHTWRILRQLVHRNLWFRNIGMSVYTPETHILDLRETVTLGSACRGSNSLESRKI
jgi:hypothetical protein